MGGALPDTWRWLTYHTPAMCTSLGLREQEERERERNRRKKFVQVFLAIVLFDIISSSVVLGITVLLTMDVERVHAIFQVFFLFCSFFSLFPVVFYVCEFSRVQLMHVGINEAYFSFANVFNLCILHKDQKIISICTHTGGGGGGGEGGWGGGIWNGRITL